MVKTAKLGFLLVVIAGCAALKKSNPEADGTHSRNNLSDRDNVQFERLFFSANKEKMLGNYEEAAVLFAQCIRKDPSSAVSMYELANIYSLTGKQKETLFFAKKAATLEPDNKWYQLFLAEMYKNNKLFDKAIKVYRQLLKQYPDNMDYRYSLATIMVLAGDFNEAINEYNKIEEQTGVIEEVTLQKELIYINLNKVDKAAEELIKLIKTDPSEPRYYGMLAELYQANNKYELALETYQKLLEVSPDDAHVHLSLANFYRSRGEKEKYFEELKKAFYNPGLEIDKKGEILLSYYSLTEDFPELIAQAMELCRILVEIHPDEAKAYALFADYLYREKKLSEAKNHYKKAVQIDQSRFFIWRQLLQIESELKDFDALLDDSRQAIELFPNQSILYLYNGIANIQKMKLENAIEILNQGVNLTKDNNLLLSTFYSNLGDSYHSKNDTGASDTAYDKAIEYDPENIYVLNNYSYYLSLRGKDLEKAKEMSLKAINLEPENISFLDTYGWILFQFGEFSEARVWIEKALEKGGDSRSTILEHYGDVLFKQGEPEKAVQYWIEAEKKGGSSDLLNKKIADKKWYEKL